MTMNDTALATASAVQSDALSTREEFSTELAPTAGVEAARQEIQATVILAKRFPRNEDEAYAKIIKSCKRPTFAQDTEYSFPRGGKSVTGPSIYLAREFARLWGNIRHGCDIVADDAEKRTIRAWAWDVETNTKVSSDVTFEKLIQRKNKNTGTTNWIKPDERDLRELTNKHAAISKRNCLLELLPSDMVEDACKQARQTLKNQAAEDPDAQRKTIINAFSDLNVPIASLETYLGHPLAQCSPEELVNLRSIYKSIKDGNSTWNEYVNGNNHSDDAGLKQKADEAAAKLREKLTKDETPKAEEKTADETPVIIGEPIFDSPSNEQPEAESGLGEPAEAPETSAAPSPEEKQKADLLVQARDLHQELKAKARRQADEWLGQRMLDQLSITELEEYLDVHSPLVD